MSALSFPRWYRKLYPAVGSAKSDSEWPLLAGEMGRLLLHLKGEMDAGNVSRSDATRLFEEYKKQVSELAYTPTKEDIQFQENYVKEDWAKRGLKRSYYKDLWTEAHKQDLENAEMEFYNSVACEEFKPGYFLVHREQQDTEHPDAVKGFYYKMYGYFPSVTWFKNWLDDLPEEHKMFHEQVQADRPQKIFFDIDAEQPKIDAAAAQEGCILHGKKDVRGTLFTAILAVVKSEFHKVYNRKLHDEDIVICDSSNAKKFSRHVLITNFHVKNHQERKYFSLIVHSALVGMDKWVGGFLDSAPLISPTASLRIAGCHKWGQIERTKKIVSEHTFYDSVIQCISRHSVALPALAPPPGVCESRSANGLVVKKVCKAVEKFFPGLYDTKKCERKGNLFIFAATHAILCPFCGVNHGNYLSHGVMVSLVGRVMKAFCPRYDAHPEAPRADEKLKEIGKLSYPTWYIDVVEAMEESGQVSTLVPTTLPNLERIREKELSRDLCINYLQKCDTLIVRSPMGTAKTKAIINYCEKKKPERVLILGCRVAYDKGLAVRYSKGETKYINYLDVKEKKHISLAEYKHLVVQIESLHRLVFEEKDGVAVWPDLLILDEIEGLLQQFTHDTMITAGTIHRCWEVFEALVKYSKKVIMMDAFVGSRTVDFAKRMRDTKTTISVANTYPAAEKRRYFVSPKLKQIATMQKFLSDGLPFVFCSNSLRHIKKVKKILEDTITDKKLPPKKIRDYTSETGQEMRKDLEDPDKAWADVDVLMYSPTITIGCSFEVDHFACIFAYFVETSCGFLDCLQMLGRVRDCKYKGVDEHCYNIAFSDRYMTFDEPPTATWIENCLEKTYLRSYTNSQAKTKRSASNEAVISFRLDGVKRHIESDGKLHLVKDNYFHTQISNTIAEIRSRNNFVYELIRHIIDTGANVDLDLCSGIPEVAADILEDLAEREGTNTVLKKEAYNARADELEDQQNGDAWLASVAKDAIVKAEKEVKKEEATRLATAESLTPVQVEEINSNQRGQMGQSTLNAVAKAALATAYGVKSTDVDYEFAKIYSDPKTRAVFKRLRESTTGESISASIKSLKQKSGAIILTNMSSSSSSTQLDCKDRSLRHELCEELMKIMHFDLSSTRRWEELEPPSYDTVVSGLREGLPAYISKYHEALVREAGKRSSSLSKPEQWEDKRCREFMQGILQSTYGIWISMNGKKEIVSLSLDSIFQWNTETERYEAIKTTK